MLTGKTILVTGISNKQSLAYSAAKAIKEAGGDIILTYYPRKTYKYIEYIISELEPVQSFYWDFEYGEEFPTPLLDGAVHSIAYADKSILENEAQHMWKLKNEANRMMSASVLTLGAVVECVKTGAPVVTYSYVGAQRAVPGYNGMGVAKAALESYARYISNDGFARVNVISAGPVQTRASSAIEGFDRLMTNSQFNSPGHGDQESIFETVGDLTAFLLSDRSRAICGETIYVDGGLHMVNGA